MVSLLLLLTIFIKYSWVRSQMFSIPFKKADISFTYSNGLNMPSEFIRVSTAVNKKTFEYDAFYLHISTISDRRYRVERINCTKSNGSPKQCANTFTSIISFSYCFSKFSKVYLFIQR